MATFAAGLRTPFARYWLSGFLADFGDGVRLAAFPLRDTAAVTCVPRLVQPDRLDQANARLIAGQIVGNELAGPAASGALFGLAAVLLLAIGALGGVATGGLGALLARLGPWRSLLLVGAPPLAVLTWRHRSGRCEV